MFYLKLFFIDPEGSGSWKFNKSQGKQKLNQTRIFRALMSQEGDLENEMSWVRDKPILIYHTSSTNSMTKELSSN